MERRRIDEVRISLRRGIVVIPWSSRGALIERLRNLGSMDVVDAFQVVETTQPVRLTHIQKALLLNAITFWASEMDNEYADLPEGIYGLRNALHDDLHQVGIDATEDGGVNSDASGVSLR